ncbi:hypothetical protein QBC34DRAFT_311656, partial [Podospora aff. communis PSN243]
MEDCSEVESQADGPTRSCAGDSCGKDTRWMCSVCGEGFCDPCWDEHLPQLLKLNRKHEKVPIELFRRMNRIRERNRRLDGRTADYDRELHSKWFGFVRGDSSRHLSFGSTPRLATVMTECLTDDCPRKIPSIVSFLGQTGNMKLTWCIGAGSGKSTVIRMLIESHVEDDSDLSYWASPICSESGDPRPGTGDVQLFADPSTNLTPRPMIFADSEGLDGGEREPRAVLEVNRTNPITTNGNLRPVSAPSSEIWGRGNCVSDIMPKFLFSLSDTIVFVTKNPRNLHRVVSDKLIPWAHDALPARHIKPHLVILVNAQNSWADDQMSWEPGTATRNLLKSLDDGFSEAPHLQDVAQKVGRTGTARGPITTIHSLIKVLYASVTCIWLPRTSDYVRMDQQIRALYDALHK